MLETVLVSLLIISVVIAIITGNTAFASTAFFNGMNDAVTFFLSIIGMTAFWSGIMGIAEKCGVIDGISVILRPVTRCLFGKSSQDAAVATSVSKNISANIIGLGNAATPPGLKAVNRLYGMNDEKSIGKLILLNTASVQLIPFTVASIRAANGSESPFSITLPVLAVSAVSLFSGLLMYRILNVFKGK